LIFKTDFAKIQSKAVPLNYGNYLLVRRKSAPAGFFRVKFSAVELARANPDHSGS